MNRNLEIDDNGTTQSDAVEMLTILRDRAFDSSDEKLALAMGRPTEEIEAWREGSAPIDEDAVMKVRGIAIQRGIELENGGADAFVD